MEREFNSTFHNNSYIYSVLPTFQVPVQELDLDYLFEFRLLVAQLVKNLPSMLETWVRSLGWEYLLKKGKATHSSILAYGSEAFQMAQMVKSLPAMPETQVQSLGWEDLLQKEMANHSSILVWKIPWTEEPGYSPWGHKESDTTEQLQSKSSGI